MARHFLELEGAETVDTEPFLLAQRAIVDLYEAGAMGAIHGEAGTGKTFAVEDALRQTPQLESCWITFPSRPTMRTVASCLLAALTRTTPSIERNRFETTAVLLDVLSHERWVIVVDEAQRLNRECIEYLRYLHDHPVTRFALVLVGGDGCWEVLAREPMLRSRIYRRVVFRPLSSRQVLEMVGRYHPLYQDAPADLVLFIDEYFGHGNFRNWAAFTRSAQDVAHQTGRERIDEAVARNVFALHGGGAAAH
jgi:DNA transposition AAA+ family ATPase